MHSTGICRSWIVWVLLICLAFAGCGRSRVSDPPTLTVFAPISLGDRPGLHNVLQLNERLSSGSGPEGEAGFRSLQTLGIKTVISVDGAKPEVATAGRFGLRYVHLPIGYDRVPRETAVRIARAIHDLPGPVYVHCHHGKHRGPAAAMAALRCLDENCPASTALEFLRTAGTDPKYKGLYASVETSTVATPLEWEKAGNHFPETVIVPDLVRLMVGIDDRWDRMNLIRAAGWKTPNEHSDIDPPHEALQLVEHYREASRLVEIRTRSLEFTKLLKEAEQSAGDLERTLRAKPVRAESAEVAFARSSNLCAKCHRLFRDQ